MDENIKFDMETIVNQLINTKINNAIASMSPDKETGSITAKMLGVLNKYGIDSLKGLTVVKELMECCIDINDEEEDKQ